MKCYSKLRMKKILVSFDLEIVDRIYQIVLIQENDDYNYNFIEFLVSIM